jgi:hypothetical protein
MILAPGDKVMELGTGLGFREFLREADRLRTGCDVRGQSPDGTAHPPELCAEWRRSNTDHESRWTGGRGAGLSSESGGLVLLYLEATRDRLHDHSAGEGVQ